MKDAETLVFMCAIEAKELLMEAAPEIHFETDHYKGWPALLIRLRHQRRGTRPPHRDGLADAGGGAAGEGMGATAGRVMKNWSQP